MTQSAANSIRPHLPGGDRHSETITNPPTHSPLQILFVEDSDFDCSLLVRLLHTSGFDFQWQRVEDEVSMRAALAERHWNAIISDHYMPNFSSTRALEIYNELALDEPFIIVSGEIGEGMAVEAMLAGADDYVLKSRLARLPPALTRSLRATEGRRLRLATESALRMSEARLQSITSNLPGMVFQIAYDVKAEQWRFEYVSEGAERILGASPAALAHDAAVLLRRVSVEDRQNLANLFRQAQSSMREIRWQARIEPIASSQTLNDSIANGETMLGSSSSGAPHGTRWIELSGSPRAGDSGSVMWEGVIMDVTAQKDAEEALKRSREDIRALSIHLENAKEEERKAIARDIHDDVGGILASLKFDIAWLQSHPSVDDEQRERIGAMAEALASARSATYRIMRDLRPSVLNLGIVAAIEWLAAEFRKRHAIPCAFASNRETITLPDSHNTAMFRIGQEALTNIVKHAEARSIRIELFEQASAVTLEITDDGGGIEAEKLTSMNRFGIRGMRERADNLGGWLEVSSSADGGTSVMLSLPKTKVAAP
ncbi:MAG: ATP-binding protein [Burkholderiales bacterium]